MRSVTLQSILNRARTHADMKNSRFISDTEALELINEIYPELYDEQVAATENYFATTANIVVTSGTVSYPLPDDFYKSLGVEFQVSNDQYITLQPYLEGERNRSLTTNNNIPTGTVRLRYVPAPPVFTALTETIDGQAGWDRLLSLLLAIDFLDSEETQTDRLYRKYQRTLKRIQEMTPRDQGMPARILDVHQPNIQHIYGAFKYRFYQNTVEFISTEYLGADGLFTGVI